MDAGVHNMKHPCKNRSYQSSPGDLCGDSSGSEQQAGDGSLNGYDYNPPTRLQPRFQYPAAIIDAALHEL